VPDTMPPPTCAISTTTRRLKLARERQLQPLKFVPETPPLPAAVTPVAVVSATPPQPPTVLAANFVVGETPPHSQSNAASAVSPQISQIYIRRRTPALAEPPPAPALASSLFSPSSPVLPIKGRGRLRAQAAIVLSPDLLGAEAPSRNGVGCRDAIQISSSSSSSSSMAGSSSAWDDECGVCGNGHGQLLCCEGEAGCTRVFHKACIGCVMMDDDAARS
jgi:hypothetical protein